VDNVSLFETSLTINGSVLGTVPATTVEPSDPTSPVFGTDRGQLTLNDLTINGLSGTADAVLAGYSGPINVLDSTITNSGTAVCGCGPDGEVNVTDSTISGNAVAADVNESGYVAITASTIAANGAGLTQNRGPFAGYSIAANILSDNNGQDCALSSGALLDYGYNIDADGTCGLSAVNHSQSEVDPMLLPLGNYAGPTQTMPPLAGSPAIDQIPVGGPSCPGIDQRGVFRPQGPACDIGAVEVEALQGASTHVTVTTLPISSVDGAAVDYQATVTSQSGTPTGSVTFTIGSTTLCATDLSNGAGSCSATNAPVGTDNVTGTYSGSSKFAGSLGTGTLTVTGGPPTAPGGGGMGYWMVGSDGGVFAFGNAGYVGSLPGLGVHVNDIVAVVPTGDGRGHWMVGKDGGVFAFGDARYLGSLPGLGVHVNDIVGVVPTHDNAGYWMVGKDGGAFAFGDASYVGSSPGAGINLNDIVGVVPTKDNAGYWMVGSNGAVFAIGDAHYFGSLHGLHVTVNDIVGVVPAADGNGYWMVGSDGGVFAFGDAGYVGSLPGLGVHVTNVVGVVPTDDAAGYWMVGSDGGVFAFGDAGYVGSLPGLGVHIDDIVGVLPT